MSCDCIEIRVADGSESLASSLNNVITQLFGNAGITRSIVNGRAVWTITFPHSDIGNVVRYTGEGDIAYIYRILNLMGQVTGFNTVNVTTSPYIVGDSDGYIICELGSNSINIPSPIANRIIKVANNKDSDVTIDFGIKTIIFNNTSTTTFILTKYSSIDLIFSATNNTWRIL